MIHTGTRDMPYDYPGYDDTAAAPADTQDQGGMLARLLAQAFQPDVAPQQQTRQESPQGAKISNVLAILGDALNARETYRHGTPFHSALIGLMNERENRRQIDVANEAARRRASTEAGQAQARYLLSRGEREQARRETTASTLASREATQSAADRRAAEGRTAADQRQERSIAAADKRQGKALAAKPPGAASTASQDRAQARVLSAIKLRISSAQRELRPLEQRLSDARVFALGHEDDPNVQAAAQALAQKQHEIQMHEAQYEEASLPPEPATMQKGAKPKDAYFRAMNAARWSKLKPEEQQEFVRIYGEPPAR